MQKADEDIFSFARYRCASHLRAAENHRHQLHGAVLRFCSVVVEAEHHAALFSFKAHVVG